MRPAGVANLWGGRSSLHSADLQVSTNGLDHDRMALPRVVVPLGTYPEPIRTPHIPGESKFLFVGGSRVSLPRLH